MSAEKAQQYFAFFDVAGSDDAVIEEAPDGIESFELVEGAKLVKRFPKAATIRFSKAYKGRELRDFLPNTLSVPIASPAARAVIESLAVADIEFLPVDVLDHRGRVAGPGYSILNPLGAQDAIDMKRSDCRMNPLDPDEIQRIRRLVLDRGAIAPAAGFFRCSRMPTTYLIREDVKRAFEAAGLTGYKAIEAESWNGLPI